MEQGPLAPTAVVAARVRELRARRQWSAQRLVDEMNKLGIDWNRGVVAKLETGRRESVSVGELMGLARVFDVAPTVLLVPPTEQAVAVTPKTIAENPLRLYDWIIGRVESPEGAEPEVEPQRSVATGLPDYLQTREFQRRETAGEVLPALAALSVPLPGLDASPAEIERYRARAAATEEYLMRLRELSEPASDASPNA